MVTAGGGFAVIDLVSRKWICALLSAEETATQTQALFPDALEAENLIGAVENRLDTGELPTPTRSPSCRRSPTTARP